MTATMTTAEAYAALSADATVSPVLMEWVVAGGLPDADRDARIERHNGCDFITLDEAGHGVHSRPVSETTADKLIGCGLCRDAR